MRKKNFAIAAYSFRLGHYQGSPSRMTISLRLDAAQWHGQLASGLMRLHTLGYYNFD
jgi:hypothetical protein